MTDGQFLCAYESDREYKYRYAVKCSIVPMPSFSNSHRNGKTVRAPRTASANISVGQVCERNKQNNTILWAKDMCGDKLYYVHIEFEQFDCILVSDQITKWQKWNRKFHCYTITSCDASVCVLNGRRKCGTILPICWWVHFVRIVRVAFRFCQLLETTFTAYTWRRCFNTTICCLLLSGTLFYSNTCMTAQCGTMSL